MGKFGWSYPAGCSGPPDEGPMRCSICGGDGADDCQCPPCQVCGTMGDAACVTAHGVELVFLKEAHDRLRTVMQQMLQEEAAAEAKSAEAWAKDEAEWEKRDAAAWDLADMESDEAYQAAHRVEADPGEVPYDEHSDSAYQCGKDRDDR